MESHSLDCSLCSNVSLNMKIDVACYPKLLPDQSSCSRLVYSLVLHCAVCKSLYSVANPNVVLHLVGAFPLQHTDVVVVGICSLATWFHNV